ncbi:hypothetical protein [Arthrobacter sp. JCM 19049]|nr:hypothetical protein [Arthrobacter sp. JCM 19049]
MALPTSGPRDPVEGSEQRIDFLPVTNSMLGLRQRLGGIAKIWVIVPV